MDLQTVGNQIEHLLDELEIAVIPREFDNVTEVVRLVTELYGGALERVLSLAQASSPELVDELLADQLVAGLLLVHGLHPVGLEQRVEAALTSVRPFLQGHKGDVELLDIDTEVGAVRLRLLGSCDGCPSSAITLQMAVEKAIHEAAPEIGIIDVDGRGDELVPAGPADGGGVGIALGRKPVYERCPTEIAASIA